MDGTSAMLIAHTLNHAGDCRRWSIGWKWSGKWSSQDWKNAARSEIILARELRLSGLTRLTGLTDP